MSPFGQPQNAALEKKYALHSGKEPLFRLQFPKEVKNRIGTVKSDSALLYTPLV